MASKCILKSCEYPSSKIFLPDMQAKCIGRSSETKILNTRCSRNQVEFCANYKSYNVKATQIGPNPSCINGILLPYKTSMVLKHGDSIELVTGALKYMVHFESSHLQENWQQLFKKEQKVENKIEPSSVEMVWEEACGGEILVLNRKHRYPKKKIAAYDMDGTLITTSSGLVFPKGYDDWKVLFGQVPNKLNELWENDFKLVIFTNQAGIGNGKQTVKGVQEKISAIIQKLGINAQVIVSTGKRMYRKPRIGMWQYFLKECNENIPISKGESFYVGDAAGRLEQSKKRKKDHSCADRLFALNIELPFYTPEEHFLGKESLPYKMPPFDPRNIAQKNLLEPENSQLYSSNSPEVILLVGYPGSGKSHFYHSYLKRWGYVHANRDILGSWQNCVSVMEKAILDKKSVCVDNTNPDIESRRRYLNVAIKLKVPIRCFAFNISIEQSMHNNIFRELTGSLHKNVNIMVYNLYKSNYQEPSTDEGFSEIVNVNYISKFTNDEQKHLYGQFLLEK